MGHLEDLGGNSSNTLFGKALRSTRCCDCSSNLILKFYTNGQQILFFNLSNLAMVGDLILKRAGPCGWLRPTQFKPQQDWVGSAAQVWRYCVEGAAQGFVHALASLRPMQFTVPGLRPTRLMFSLPMSLLVLHNLVISGRLKNVYCHLLSFLTLMFSSKVKTNQYIFHLLFLRLR